MKNIIELMSSELSLSVLDIQALVRRAPFTYKKYSIPKKGKGRRSIAQPAKETKYLQHWLIKNVYSELPVHEASCAYSKGSSIKKNANIHRKNAYICKFDFKDFFTSIKLADLELHFSKHIGKVFSQDDIKLMARVCCIKQNSGQLGLSIGAPTSPLLSNSIMYELDILLTKWAADNEMAYSRYADDLVFSTNVKRMSSEVEPALRRFIRQLEYPNLRLNNKKTVHLSMKTRRSVTGLVITNDQKISIGRDRKRKISAMIHKFINGDLEEEQILELQGLLGFAKGMEPLFIQRMTKKYGNEALRTIFKMRKDPMSPWRRLK